MTREQLVAVVSLLQPGGGWESNLGLQPSGQTPEQQSHLTGQIPLVTTQSKVPN